MWRRKPRSVPGGAKAFGYAVAVHVTLLLLLGISLRFSTRPSEPPRVVQARVMDEAPKPAAEPPDTARLQEQARRQAEAERARQAEVKKQQEAERRQQKEAERKQELERKKKSDEAEKKKAAALEKKRAEERRRQEAETALQSEVAAEEQRRVDSERRRWEQSEIERFHSQIQQKVSRNWNISSTSRKGLKCVLRVRVVSGGEVLAVSVVTSSGDAAFDRSAENAIYKASPLPVPADAALFNRVFREFDFDFDPEKYKK